MADINDIKELFSDLYASEVDQALNQALGNSELEAPNNHPQIDIKNHGFSGLNRPKTSMRLGYEAEVSVLRKKLGSLEDIRKNLGLSRRKMAQLLMVDPSAWTRWTRDDTKVPPHIYRSLQWYLELVERSPEYHPKNSFQPAAYTEQNAKLLELSKQMDAKIEGLEKRLATRDAIRGYDAKTPPHGTSVGPAWKLLLLINTGLLLAFLLSRLLPL